MREAAYTIFGRNALSAGLVSHVSALIAGMMTVAGAQTFAMAAYGFACLAIAAGAYTELKGRGLRPLLSLTFYAAVIISAVPVAGPVAVVLLLYAVQGSRKPEPFTTEGLILSLPRLNINPLVLFFFLTILFILFALSIVQRDPYYERVRSGKASVAGQEIRLACSRDVRTPALPT